ncbi:hypothetical protein [Mesorhizobium wenxiniae]|uniref:Uncharacterized protein n=1 Tax=Mesorhizobium wenxiniae TaxID=2014805 RepID=A0A271KF60_9HYPH|nr:hypothetical protein [Mesorhizobium wenxiniae]PAP94336.1 hypothetical protein CIT31_18770 [Mesorhizobium wenxiniae]
MQAKWREFEQLRRQPWNPSVAIILYRDGSIVNKRVNEFERVSVQLAELDKTLAKQSLKDHELSG